MSILRRHAGLLFTTFVLLVPLACSAEPESASADCCPDGCMRMVECSSHWVEGTPEMVSERESELQANGQLTAPYPQPATWRFEADAKSVIVATELINDPIEVDGGDLADSEAGVDAHEEPDADASAEPSADAKAEGGAFGTVARRVVHLRIAWKAPKEPGIYTFAELDGRADLCPSTHPELHWDGANVTCSDANGDVTDAGRPSVAGSLRYDVSDFDSETTLELVDTIRGRFAVSWRVSRMVQPARPARCESY